MQQEKVDVLEAEASEAALEADESFVVAVIAVPQLRGDEQLAAVDSRRADRLADFAFVVVRGGGIDQVFSVNVIGVVIVTRLLPRRDLEAPCSSLAQRSGTTPKPG